MELLAPAGNMENFEIALEQGADAIYLGGKNFSARTKASNFDEKELAAAIKKAHLLHVPIYITVNTIIADHELQALSEYIKLLEELRVDGIIVQDLGVAAMIREIAPSIPLHGSTQMTVTNLGTVTYLERLGFSRVVLGRELSLEEIKYICANTTMEVEVFVHGALCISYSGQCLMSSFIGGRSGNRGACAQPCRLPYELIDGKGKRRLPKEETFIISPKDLNYADSMKELIEAGVHSFKVEGRMKNADYVSNVISTYRSIIDEAGTVTEKNHKALEAVFNRGFSNRYLLGNADKTMMTIYEPTPVMKTTNENLKGIDRRKISLHAYLHGSVGDTVSLTLVTDSSISVTVSSEYTLVLAKTVPTSSEKIREQLSRLGNTLFSLQSLCVPEGPYMWPASVLNELRRKGIEALEGEILKRYEENRVATHQKVYQYSPSICCSGGVENSRETTLGQSLHIPCISAHVDEWEGVVGAINGGARKIIFGGDRLRCIPYESSIYKQVADYCRAHDAYLSFATPRVIRAREEEAYKKTLQAMVAAKPQSITVNFLGLLLWLEELGYDGSVEGDVGLNIFNGKSIAFLAQQGLQSVAISQEATLHQIRQMAKSASIPLECVVHGRTEMMISDYCVVSSFLGNGKKEGCPKPCLQDHYALRDRKKVDFPIRTDPYCRMHILNSKELNMMPYIPTLHRHGVSIFRVDGRQQSKSYIESIVKEYRSILERKKELPTKEDSNVTRGHYFKGIF